MLRASHLHRSLCHMLGEGENHSVNCTSVAEEWKQNIMRLLMIVCQYYTRGHSLLSAVFNQSSMTTDLGGGRVSLQLQQLSKDEHQSIQINIQ